MPVPVCGVMAVTVVMVPVFLELVGMVVLVAV